jgi:hypothetical protein
MDYDSIENLDMLLSDSSATEFKESLLDIPVDLSQSNFDEWLTKAISDWGSDYQSMLENLKRLVEGYINFDAAMSAIKTAQDKARPPAPVVAPAPDPVQSASPPKKPEEAAKVLNQQFAPLIEKLKTEHSAVVEQFDPQELADAFIKGIASAIQ